MKRPSKRPSLVERSDAVRVPVPTLEPSPDQARYLITPLGRVYRDDGRLLTPRDDLKIRVNGNVFCRAIPLLVFLAFAHPGLVEAREAGPLADWHPWVDKFGPRDDLTGVRRCTVDDVMLVPHGELVRYGRRGIVPTTRLPILKLPPKNLRAPPCKPK